MNVGILALVIRRINDGIRERGEGGGGVIIVRSDNYRDINSGREWIIFEVEIFRGFVKIQRMFPDVCVLI